MRKALLVLVAGVIIWAGTGYAVKAQISGEDWVRIGTMGINTQSVAVSPNYTSDQTVFAGTQGQGLWYSTDGGSTWVQSTGYSALLTKTVVAIAVSPSISSDGTVFCLTSDGYICKSTTHGVTFGSLQTSISGAGTSLAISPNYASDGKVWAGFAGVGLYYSANFGASWTQDSTSPTRFPTIYALAVSPSYSADGKLFVGGHATDYGGVSIWSGAGSWTNDSSGLGAGALDTVYSLVALTSTQLWAGTILHGMYATTNGGQSWSAACDGTVTSTVPTVMDLAVSHGSASLLLEGRADQLFQSTSSILGTTCTSTTPIDTIQSLAIEPQYDASTHCAIFVGTPHGLFRKGCAVSLKLAGPRASAADIKVVSMAYATKGAYFGSATLGLLKAESPQLSSTGSSLSVVQYNAFPNKQTPDIVAICLDPAYNEGATACSTDASVLFVAANFPSSPSSNGVYKSADWGNTWMQMTGGAWPTSTVTMYDLAISSHYAEGSSDTTLFVATSAGLFRWDGGTTYWVDVSRNQGAAVYKIGLAPTFTRAGSGTYDHTIFEAEAGGVYYSLSLGSSGSWYATGFVTDGGPCHAIGSTSAFAFPVNFGVSGGTTRVFLSIASTSCSSVYTSATYPWGTSTWKTLTDGLPAGNVGANGFAADPQFDENSSSHKRLLVATPSGVYWGTFATSTPSASWTATCSTCSPGLSVAFDVGGTGTYALAGYRGAGAALSRDTGKTFPAVLTGYNSLPDDVFQTIPDTRINPTTGLPTNVVFASSPSMGAFISENKGLSFRPWNKGTSGSSGPCALRSAYGMAFMQDRGGTGWDVVWVGTNNEGIKFKFVYWDGSAYSLDSCGSCYWQNTYNMSSGRFERFTTLGTGTANPVYAASSSKAGYSAQGIWYTPDYYYWYNSNSIGGDSPSVRFGYDPLLTITPLTSGTPVNGQSVAYTAWNYYAMTVPSGMANLTITMTPLSNDPDLYVRFGALPDYSLWDYRPYYGTMSVETVSIDYPAAGVWYLGVNGYGSSGETYNLVATTSLTAVAHPAESLERSGEAKPECNPFESAPSPKAPSSGALWGTVTNSGVERGTITGGFTVQEATASISWELRNGSGGGALSNLDSQTVTELKDGTVIAGCLGDVFYSPAPDEGRTLWVKSTPNVAGACSDDFRDLYEVDIVPGSPSDLRTDCLLAAYGTGASTSGGVWLSGDKGHHWIKISSGFDPNSQKLVSIVGDAGTPTSYYSSTNGTGVYTRTITLQAYPTVTSLTSTSGGTGGGGSITITGTGFSNACPTGSSGDCLASSPVAVFGVKADGTDNDAVTTYVNSTTLTAIVPSHAGGSVQVTVRNPDTRRAVSGPTYSYTCAAPSGLGTITAVDLDPYAKSGVEISWPASPAAWNDGASGGRAFHVLRNGADISGPLFSATSSYVDGTGTANVSYSYSVKYVNGCSQYATTTSVVSSDQFLLPAEAGATPPTALTWTAGAANKLTWGSTTGATGYKVYKGTSATMANLAGAGATVCVAYQGAGVGSPPSTGNILTSNPPPGTFFWYLVSATNGAGEGTLGTGTGGSAHNVNSTGPCGSP